MEKVNILQTELHSQQMPEVREAYTGRTSVSTVDVMSQVLLTLNTLALNMVSVVHNALKIFDSCQKQLLGPDNQRTQVVKEGVTGGVTLIVSLPLLPSLPHSPSLSLPLPPSPSLPPSVSSSR